MKAKDIVNDLGKVADDRDYSNSCDQYIVGDCEKETSKVAVTMFGTAKVIKEAQEWGADLLIVHEPLCFGNEDPAKDEIVMSAKRKLAEDSGMEVYRYHDHPHFAFPDMIAAGELRQIGFKGEIEYTDVCDLLRIHLEKPMTPREIALLIEEKCNLKHIRIAGAIDTPCNEVSAMFGAPIGMFEELRNEKCEILLSGESLGEWTMCEYARDAAELGFKKALIVMGHIGSERDGMKYIADVLKDMHPEIEVKYFECDEAFKYTD